MIHRLKEIFGKNSLRRNVLFLALSNTLPVFLILLVILPVGLFFVQRLISDKGNQWGEHVAALTEKAARLQMEYYLRDIVAAQSQLIEKNLDSISDDVNNIAAGVEQILANQRYYRPRHLPTSRDESIPIGVAYVHYSDRMLGNVPPDVQEEIYRVSNVEDIFIATMRRDYFNHVADVTLCSEKGYVITMDYDPSKQSFSLPDDFLSGLDPQQYSTWYRAVKETGKIFFTEPHFGLDSNYIHCGAPYFVDGQFAGGVAIGTDVTDLYNQIINVDLNKTRTDSAEDFGKDIEIVINGDGKIILSSERDGLFAAADADLRLYPQADVADVARRMTNLENDVATLTVDGVEYYIAFAPIEIVSWSFATIIKQTKINSEVSQAKEQILTQLDDFNDDIRNIFLFMIAGSLLMILLLMIIFLRFGVKEADKFLQPIQTLIEDVQDISTGNFDRRLPTVRNDEIGSLARAVNGMAGDLKKYMADLTRVTADKQRISTELNIATKIQQSMLPHDFNFGRDDFELFATMHAAKEVGGDFYDFYPADENHLVVTIADVSDKGVPAALFMAISKTVLQNFTLSTPEDLAAAMSAANRQLCRDNEELLFVTVFTGILNLKTGEFVYVDGGHNPPLICRGGRFEYLDAIRSCMLGVDEDVSFTQQKIFLDKGDMIFLYTDGVTEAMNEDGEQFLPERLQDVLNREDMSAPLPKILEHVQRAVKEHTGDAPQSDDVTMLVLRR